MAYETMEKLFRMDSTPERFANNTRLAQERLLSDSTFRTGIMLDEGELFLAVPRELSVTNERLLRRERRVSALWRTLPPIAHGAYLRSLILDEVVSSNEMEGVRSTRRQVRNALDEAWERGDGAGGVPHTPFVELARLYLDLGEGADDIAPESLADIRLIYDHVVHGTIPKGNRPEGSLFRQGEVHIDDRGRIRHSGVMPERRIEELLEGMLDFVRSPEIPATFSAVLSHYLFEYVHPFYDGNGRTGRYLLAAFLSDALSVPTVLSLSRVIAENKRRYYRAFDVAEQRFNHAEGTHFVMTMLDLIGLAQEQLIANLEEKCEALDRVERRIDSCAQRHGLSKKAVELLFFAAQTDLFGQLAEVRVATAAEHLECGTRTASKYLRELEEAGMLVGTSSHPLRFQLDDSARLELGIG